MAMHPITVTMEQFNYWREGTYPHGQGTARIVHRLTLEAVVAPPAAHQILGMRWRMLCKRMQLLALSIDRWSCIVVW